MRRFKIVLLFILVIALFTSVVAKGEGEMSTKLITRYTSGLQKYHLAKEPWLDEEEVNKRVNSQIKLIEKNPDSSMTKDYLRKIEDSFLTVGQRKVKAKKGLLAAISDLRLDEKQKKRLMELSENFDIKVTEKDFQTFLPSQAKEGIESQKIQSAFVYALLLRSNKSQDFVNYYGSLPNKGLKKIFYLYHSNSLHVYEKSPENRPFYMAVIKDLLTRTSDSTGLDSELLSNFMSVLRNLRAIGYFPSLEIFIKEAFKAPTTNNKARYAFVVAALQMQRHDVSLNLAKKYYTEYSGDIKELTYLTKFFYWHWSREEIDPVVQAKINEFMKPVRAIMNEMPKDKKLKIRN